MDNKKEIPSYYWNSGKSLVLDNKTEIPISYFDLGKSLVESCIKMVIENDCSGFYLDEEYSIQSQMTDYIQNLIKVDDTEMEREEVNEWLDEYEEDLDKIVEILESQESSVW